MNKKITFLIASIFSTLLMWRLFSLILSNDKVDLFLFYELEQYPFWYVFYTSMYVREILYSIVIYILICSNPNFAINGFSSLKMLSLFLVIMASLRLLVYWLFRGSINLDILVACVVIYSILSVIKWPRLQ